MWDEYAKDATRYNPLNTLKVTDCGELRTLWKN